MRNDITELKKIVYGLMPDDDFKNQNFISQNIPGNTVSHQLQHDKSMMAEKGIAQPIVIEESLSLVEKEKELIAKALKKHRGRRRNAAKELGISERTLYRKIKDYKIPESGY
jgi:DNA-binding NtrC family response regulator